MWRRCVVSSSAVGRSSSRRVVVSRDVTSRWDSPVVAHPHQSLVSLSSRVQSQYWRSSSSTSSSGIQITRTSAADLAAGAAASSPEKEPPQAPVSSSNNKGKENHVNVVKEEQPSVWREATEEQQRRIMELQSHIRTHHEHANYTEAQSCCEDLLTMSQESYGTRHPVTASAHNNLALMHKLLGAYEPARQQYHAALSVYSEVLGTDHESYAAALHNLGNLDRSQSLHDDSESIKALHRLQLNDSAMEYFEEAYQIRSTELGPDHHLTLASRTNLGSVMAAQILTQQANLLQSSRQTDTLNAKTTSTEKVQNRIVPSKNTRKRWEAAEVHLRAAYRTSMERPRGKKAPASSPSATTSTTSNMSPKELEKLRKIATKEIKGSRGMSSRKAARRLEEHHAAESSFEKKKKEEQQQKQQVPQVQTLSAAGAAQNLAVFLKSRADFMEHDKSLEERQTAEGSVSTGVDRMDLYAEAKNLYESALHVRSTLLTEGHPDLVVTQSSLAELLSAIGNETDANLLREQILTAMNVTETEIPDDNDNENGDNNNDDSSTTKSPS
eukprot:scaffold46682_cov37-Attheya_sp.AAC.2